MRRIDLAQGLAGGFLQGQAARLLDVGDELDQHLLARDGFTAGTEAGRDEHSTRRWFRYLSVGLGVERVAFADEHFAKWAEVLDDAVVLKRVGIRRRTCEDPC